MAAEWDARQYLKFEAERTRPARDLLAEVPLAALPLQDGALVVDLGCGPGNSTELLGARFPNAEILGLDTSREMIAAAEARFASEKVPRALSSRTRFAHADARALKLERPADLIFANAVLQWVPDHARLFPHLVAQLREGGILAVQMPDNLEEPSHVALREAAMAGPWGAELREAVAERAILPPVGFYYDLLAPRTRVLEIWHTIYNHPLDSAEAIVEWMKGTALRPFLEPLEADERAAFLAAYTARLREAYPARVDGKVLLAFPRLFLVAQR